MGSRTASPAGSTGAGSVWGPRSEPGQYSPISDFHDNVHWFKATSDTAFLFNIHVQGLKSGTGRRNGRVYIDPDGEQLSGGRIRAKKLKTAEAFKLYG